MNGVTVVAWSWGDDAYHRAACSLRAQCEEQGYAHDIHVGVDLSNHLGQTIGGEWERRQWIYRFIPHFIAGRLEGLNTDLLYLHCDMSIRAPIPGGAFDGMDIGLESGWSQYPPRPDDRVLAAPIFVRNNARARRFVGLWRAYCKYLDDGMGEHNQLLRVWRVMADKDRSLRIDIFEPPLGSIRADSDTPIVGTK